jgi:hypothetical protein
LLEEVNFETLCTNQHLNQEQTREKPGRHHWTCLVHTTPDLPLEYDVALSFIFSLRPIQSPYFSR